MSDTPRPLPGSAPAEPDPMIGRVLAERYRIDGLLARGGMARVYRARDTRLERDVAVKVLSPPYADDSEFTARFLAEARAAASLSHPSLIHVYDSGSDGAAHFIVMELLDRHRSLRQELDARGGRLPPDEVLRVGGEILAGLRVVHERGLVHCDVKPANVMLGPGPAKLIDFGIARSPREAAESATSIGSLHFMSPEHLHGRPLTPASDLFSLSVVLYEALTGRLPFRGDTPEEISAAQRGGVRPPSTLVEGISARLDSAILQGLRADPGNRFETADAMTRALGAADAEPARSLRDDTTARHPVVAAAPPPAEPQRGGYVPPPAPPPAPAPARPRVVDRRPAPQRPRTAGRSRGSVWSLIGTLAILAAAGAVVVFAVMLIRDAQGGGAGGPSATAVASPVATPVNGFATVPNTVGMATQDAIRAATEAGLNWTVYCDEDPSLPEGIIDQEPPAQTQVRQGSAFSMYSARIADCP